MEKSLENEKDYIEKYCLLNQVLVCNDEYGLIENVININKLVNKLNKKYFKITKEKKQKIKKY